MVTAGNKIQAKHDCEGHANVDRHCQYFTMMGIVTVTSTIIVSGLRPDWMGVIPAASKRPLPG